MFGYYALGGERSSRRLPCQEPASNIFTMSNSLRSQSLWLISIAMATCLTGLPCHGGISISFCGPECLCIDYSTGFGSTIEVRCNSGGEGGWATEPSEDLENVPDGPGSFGGDGEPGEGSEANAPCSSVVLENKIRLGQALSRARSKLSWKGRGVNRSPTTCTTLFRNSPLRLVPKDVLADSGSGFRAVFREAENCSLPGGQANPCSTGSAAFTTCCTHSPYIYLCSEFFEMDATEASETLIHELLHVFGQREDNTTDTGPGNPPTTHQLNDVVRAACRNPTVIPRP